MEEGGEVSGNGSSSIVELSLDSVLRKAAELEGTLREMAATRRNCSSVLSAKGVDRQEEASGTLTVREEAEQEPSGSERGAEGDIAAQWQKLTSYIVSLENELQYYKQLVEGFEQLALEERAKTAAAARDSPSQSEGSTSSSSCDGDSTGRQLDHLQENSALQQWDATLQDDRVSRVLFLVFSQLRTDELCRVSRVCRKWQRVSRHPLLWRRVTVSEATIGPQTLSRMAPLCSHMESLTLHGLMPTMAGCDEDLHSYINRTRGCLEPGLRDMLDAVGGGGRGGRGGGQTLKFLSITECNLMLTDRVFWLAGVHCPSLQRLTYCSDEFPPSSPSLWSLANGCRGILSLIFPPILSSSEASGFDDGCLSVIAHSWPHLTSLSVGGTRITLNGIAEIAQCCVRLQHLELLHGPSLNSSAVAELCRGESFSSLRSLTLTFTPTSPKAIHCLLAERPNITSLEVHVSLHTYFPYCKDPANISKYEKIIGSMKKLERQAELSKVFKLHEHHTPGLADKLT